VNNFHSQPDSGKEHREYESWKSANLRVAVGPAQGTRLQESGKKKKGRKRVDAHNVGKKISKNKNDFEDGHPTKEKVRITRESVASSASAVAGLGWLGQLARINRRSRRLIAEQFESNFGSVFFGVVDISPVVPVAG
jgi:hypothetical protein